jgi:hypothetical protein
MITLEGGSYVAQCDGCGETINTGQRSFQQAVNYISRAHGWDNRKTKDGWRNYCPRCGEEADPDLDIAGIQFTRKPIND